MTIDGVAQTLAGSFAKIAVALRGGNNRVTIDPSVTADAVLRGGPGDDTLEAGGGNDVLYAGGGRDSLVGGAGADTLVALNGSLDTLAGGSGADAFWANTGDVVDTGAADGASAVHWLDGYDDQLSAPAAVDGGASAGLPEPAITGSGITYTNFSSRPLFGAGGATPEDVVQGQLGDCYFLATLSAVAKTDPAQLKQNVVKLSDGTFAVRFVRGGKNVYEHVDAMLPTYPGGTPAYAQLGHGGSVWAAVMEKAFAFFGRHRQLRRHRGRVDERGVLRPGPQEHRHVADVHRDGAVATDPIGIEGARSRHAGGARVPAGAPLIADHAYSVDSVVADAHGTVTGLKLRNPWGIVGVGDAGNDGYVTITPAQAFAATWVVTAAAA